MIDSNIIIQLRRQEVPADHPSLYSLRFTVQRGRGVLLIRRATVLVIPPARETGTELNLTQAQVLGSSFLYISHNQQRKKLPLASLSSNLNSLMITDGWLQLRQGRAGQLLLPLFEPPPGFSQPDFLDLDDSPKLLGNTWNEPPNIGPHKTQERLGISKREIQINSATAAELSRQLLHKKLSDRDHQIKILQEEVQALYSLLRRNGIKPPNSNH